MDRWNIILGILLDFLQDKFIVRIVFQYQESMCWSLPARSRKRKNFERLGFFGDVAHLNDSNPVQFAHLLDWSCVRDHDLHDDEFLSFGRLLSRPQSPSSLSSFSSSSSSPSSSSPSSSFQSRRLEEISTPFRTPLLAPLEGQWVCYDYRRSALTNLHFGFALLRRDFLVPKERKKPQPQPKKPAFLDSSFGSSSEGEEKAVKTSTSKKSCRHPRVIAISTTNVLITHGEQHQFMTLPSDAQPSYYRNLLNDAHSIMAGDNVNCFYTVGRYGYTKWQIRRGKCVRVARLTGDVVFTVKVPREKVFVAFHEKQEYLVVCTLHFWYTFLLEDSGLRYVTTKCIAKANWVWTRIPAGCYERINDTLYDIDGHFLWRRVHCTYSKASYPLPFCANNRMSRDVVWKTEKWDILTGIQVKKPPRDAFPIEPLRSFAIVYTKRDNGEWWAKRNQKCFKIANGCPPLSASL